MSWPVEMHNILFLSFCYSKIFEFLLVFPHFYFLFRSLEEPCVPNFMFRTNVSISISFTFFGPFWFCCCFISISVISDKIDIKTMCMYDYKNTLISDFGRMNLNLVFHLYKIMLRYVFKLNHLEKGIRSSLYTELTN